jgi:signal transduction histidine kinase/ActR/RegA family two-component response regulator
VATALECALRFGQIDLAGALTVQTEDPLLWIIDTAPFFLGLFAYFAGARQDQIIEINHTLEQRVREKTENLRTTNDALKREVEIRAAREGELVEAYEEATAGTRAKDKFVSSVSHELRTPLNGIIGMADELLHTELTTEQRKSLAVLRYSANNLLSIINDVLDLAKAAANKLELSPKDFHFSDVLQSVQASVRTKVAEKGITFRTRVVSAPPPVLHGDPVRLYQIMLNLVGNAVKFTDVGSVTLEVRSTMKSETACEIDVRISDTGIGISEENQKHIFDDFAQANAAIAGKYGGTGLGLAITRKLVQLHRGELSFTSTEGEGSEFRFQLTLPVGHEVEVIDSNPPMDSTRKGIGKSKAAVKSAPAPAEEKPAEMDLRVLLVEDHPVNQLVASTFLKRYGFPFDLAENGLQAVEMAEGRHYDVILMDIHLPEIDGLEAARRIRNSRVQHARDAHIIALTASALKEEVTACLEAGMDAFASKPFKPKDLFATMVEVMRKPVTRSDDSK